MENTMRRLTAIFTALLLAGCSTVGTPISGPSGKTLDPLIDDVASLLVAFDLPRGLGPVPTAELFTFDAANGGPQEHLRLTLLPADADQVAGNLPPPSEGRAYYFFALKEQDKATLRAAQASAQARGVTASNITLGIVPHLCASGPVDPTLLTVSIYGGVPGRTRFTPFISNELLADVQKRPGSTQMPPCA
jgi:hypothetical protein